MGRDPLTTGTRIRIAPPRVHSPPVSRVTVTLKRRLSGSHTLIFPTRWGWMGVVASPKGIRRLVLPRSSRRAVERELAEDRRAPAQTRARRRSGRRSQASKAKSLAQAARQQIVRYLEGRLRTMESPLDLSGWTPFQRRVWRIARRIPYGQVRSYRWVASRVGGVKYARAVGAALGANPVPLLVPCHRVVAHGAALGGFSGGLLLKRKLLRLEGSLAALTRSVTRGGKGEPPVQRVGGPRFHSRE